jgi:transcription termination/antitermination protein NusG
MGVEKKWYVVHTYSGFEEKAKQGLLERIKLKGLTERFGEIFVPRIGVEQVLKSGKKKRVEKTSFPGYILVQMVMDDSTNLLVRETPKITGFVGNAKAPRPMSDQEVLRLTSPEAAEAAVKQTVSKVSFEKGETVKVKEGPFTNFDGVVEEVRPDKMKLRILVSIFGRETPVELDFGQVERIG